MSFKVYCNPQNVSVGGVAVEAVAKISIGENVEKFSACGDIGFADDGFDVLISRRCEGSMEFSDVNSWLLAQGITGTLSFDLVDVSSQEVLSIEIAGCTFTSARFDALHNAAGNCVVNFRSKNSPAVVAQ